MLGICRLYSRLADGVCGLYGRGKKQSEEHSNVRRRKGTRRRWLELPSDPTGLDMRSPCSWGRSKVQRELVQREFVWWRILWLAPARRGPITLPTQSAEVATTRCTVSIFAPTHACFVHACFMIHSWRSCSLSLGIRSCSLS